jgi:hypothetical protein
MELKAGAFKPKEDFSILGSPQVKLSIILLLFRIQFDSILSTHHGWLGIFENYYYYYFFLLTKKKKKKKKKKLWSSVVINHYR